MILKRITFLGHPVAYRPTSRNKKTINRIVCCKKKLVEMYIHRAAYRLTVACWQ